MAGFAVFGGGGERRAGGDPLFELVARLRHFAQELLLQLLDQARKLRELVPKHVLRCAGAAW